MQFAEMFAYIVLFVAVVWALDYAWEKYRASSMRQLAHELELDFKAKESPGFIPNCEKFPVLSQGHSRKIINRMSGVMSYGEPVLFGYQYTTGSGKNSSTYSHKKSDRCARYAIIVV